MLRNKWAHVVGMGGRILRNTQSHHIAELSVSELRRTDALLLLFYASANFKPKPNCPFQIIVRHWRSGIWIKKLEQARHCLVNGILISPRKRSAKMDATRQPVDPTLRPQPRKTLCQDITNQPEVIREQLFANLGHIPSWQIAMNAIHKCGVVPHLWRHWTK